MARPRPADGREQRRISLDRIEVRSDAATEAIEVNGHAAVWDKTAWIGPSKYGFSERFLKGAFKESINGGADVRFLFNHNPDAVLARTKSGTLTLAEDGTGLAVRANVAPTTDGRNLAILLERGDVDQMSVAMQVLEDHWEEVEGGDGGVYELRTIIRAKLFDVSGVTYPAYEETDLALRTAADHARELRDARGQHVTRHKGEPATATPPEPASQPNIGETPENPAPSGVSSSMEPATATPPEQPVDERSMPLHELLLRHAFGDHTASPRALCPACPSREPATATHA